jgi:peptidyl-prolyl cis-trans isomerase D
MLQQMRALSKSWISSIFLGALALSFGVWGVADIFRGGGADTSVATVGDAKLESPEFQRDYRTALRNASSRAGHDITTQEAHAQGFDRRILQDRIDQLAEDHVVKTYGLLISDAQVSTTIRGISAFRGVMGSFDHTTFLQVLARNDFTEAGFIEEIRQELARNQLVSATRNGLSISPGYAKLYFDWLNEQRAAQYVVVAPQAAGAVPAPTDAALTAYLKSHATRFSTPEYRDITYGGIGPDDVMNQIHVTEDQLKQQYELQKDQYQIPEKRDVEQIVFPDEASAKASRAKLDAGAKFDDIAAQRGEKPADIALGTVAAADLTGGRGAPTFALPVNGVTQPIKFTFGWALLHVTAITPGVNKTYNDMKDTLRKQIALQLATAKLTDVTNAYSDASAGGASLSEAATRVGMHVVHIPAVDKNGLAPDGTKVNLPAAPEFQAQMVKSDVGEEGDPFSTSDNHAYVIKINGITPPRLKSLDVVRGQVTAAWIAEQQRARLAGVARKLQAQANADKSLVKVAAQLHAPAQATGALTRESPPSGAVSAELVKAIFSAPPGTAVAAPSPDGNSYVVALVTGVQHPPANLGPSFYERFAQQIDNQVDEDIQSSFAAAARAKLGVTINEQQFSQIAGGS